jgi:hypothetical protein
VIHTLSDECLFVFRSECDGVPTRHADFLTTLSLQVPLRCTGSSPSASSASLAGSWGDLPGLCEVEYLKNREALEREGGALYPVPQAACELRERP